MAINPLKVLTSLSASYGAAISGSDGLKIQQGGLKVDAGNVTTAQTSIDVFNTTATTVNFAGAGTAVGIGAAAGTVTIGGDLKVGGDDILASTGATAISLSGADVEVKGDLKVAGNTIKDSAGEGVIEFAGSNGSLTLGKDTGSTVTIAGNLTVRGTTTTVDSTTVNMGDKNLNLGTGSADLAVLSGGGIDLGTGAEVQWRYNNASTAWKSNKDIDVASGQVYKINGTEVLSSNTLGSGVVNSSLTSLGSLTALNVSGSSQLSGTVLYKSNSEIQGLISTSSLNDLTASLVGIAQYAQSTLNIADSFYKANRQVKFANLVAGEADFDLLFVSASYGGNGDLTDIALDVMIFDNGAWVNDLLSVSMQLSASSTNTVRVHVSAPANPTAKVRCIGVWEGGGLKGN